MRLLIVTQKADKNDPILGFFHRWIIEFARHCESVVVIALQEGEHEFPANVRVLSLGKEKGSSKSANIGRFYSYIWQERKNYDAVFVHMNPIYVILGGLFWKLRGTRIGLWYVHRAVDLKLRIAEKMADTVFTSAPESFKVRSTKVHILGHGIDASAYASLIRPTKDQNDPITIMQVGRITEIKNCATLIAAAALLKNSWKRRFKVIFVGEPVTKDDGRYMRELKETIESEGLEGLVEFAGPVPSFEMPERFVRADVTVNLAPTGGIDKVILESLAAGTPSFFSNEAFLDIYAPYEHIFHVPLEDATALAEKIQDYFNRSDRQAMEGALRQRVLERYSLTSLIPRILAIYHDPSR